MSLFGIQLGNCILHSWVFPVLQKQWVPSICLKIELYCWALKICCILLQNEINFNVAKILIICTTYSAIYFGIFPNRRQFVNFSLFLIFLSLLVSKLSPDAVLYNKDDKTQNSLLLLTKSYCLFCLENFCSTLMRLIFVKRLTWAKMIDQIKYSFYSTSKSQSTFL